MCVFRNGHVRLIITTVINQVVHLVIVYAFSYIMGFFASGKKM